MMKKIILFIITAYQKTLSRDHGLLSYRHPYGFCRFHPTCSEYMKGSIIKHGVMRGMRDGLWRIARCNPWNKGGIDPV